MNRLSQSNLWFSKAVVFLVLLTISFSCKKDGLVVEEPKITPIDTVKPKISFVFANRLGYKPDTNSIRWLSAVNLHSQYYNPVNNTSNLVNTIYNRNYIRPILSDSITNSTYINYVGTQYAFEVTLIWDYKNSQYFRELKFHTKNWPNACDTIKVAKDTVIKFIYPDDTLPNNKFVRVL